MFTRMIAVDMDGTLLQEDKSLLASTKAYVSKFVKEYPDIAFVICTGRPASGIEPFLQELGLVDEEVFVICQNGASIIKPKTNEHVFDLFMPSASLRKWVDFAKEHQVGPLVAGLHSYYSVEQEPTDWMKVDVGLVNATLQEKTLEELAKESVYKLLLIDDPAKLDAIESLIPTAWRSEFYVVRSQPYLIEVQLKEVNKSLGLLTLAKLLNISKENTMAIGDAMNDYEMIQAAGFGVAMGNAVPAIKEIADWVTLANHEDGVVHAIQHWLHSIHEV